MPTMLPHLRFSLFLDLPDGLPHSGNPSLANGVNVVVCIRREVFIVIDHGLGLPQQRQVSSRQGLFLTWFAHSVQPFHWTSILPEESRNKKGGLPGPVRMLTQPCGRLRQPPTNIGVLPRSKGKQRQ